MVDFKGTIRIDNQFARSTPLINFSCLRCDLVNISQWISKANSTSQLLDNLINAPSNVFWSSVALRPQILEELDKVLERLPFVSELEEGGLFVNTDIAPLVTDLYAKLWVVFLRLTVNNESEGVNSTIFRQLIQQNQLLSLRRFRLYCGLFAENYFSSFKKLVGRLKQLAPELFTQYDEDVGLLLMLIESLHESIALMNAKGLGGEMRNYGQVFDFYEQLQQQIREVSSWCAFYRVMPEFRANKELLKAIPLLMEDLNESLGDHVLTNLSVGSNQLLTGLCRSVNYLKQALTKLYIRFFENYADEFDKINLLSILVDNQELLVRIADQLHDQVTILLSKSKLTDVVTRIKSAINQAYAKKSREIIESLREQGMLKSLGEYSGPEIESKVNELIEILPYTKEFLHLVLRFYSYDHETALSRLVEPDSLPFQLRVLIRDTSLIQSAEPTQTTGLHVDDVYQESDIDSEPEDGADKKATDPHDLVALLTAAPKLKLVESNKPVLSAREQRMQKTHERLQKLLEQSSDTLNMNKLHFLVDKMKQEQEKKADKTVEIGGKKYSKFYKDDMDEIDKKDKEILRQKLDEYKYEEEDVDEEYQRFKLEQQFERDVGLSGRFNRGYTGVKIQDMYDDEYQDALDEHDYGLGEGITADERSANESKAVNPIGPLGAPRNTMFSQPMKGRPPKKSQKYPQQPPAEPQPSSSGFSQAKKPVQQQQKPAKTQQPRPATDKQQQSQTQKPKAPPKQDEQTEDGDNQSGQQHKQESSKDGYTGGRGRMMKERHKGQFKQRGADRKMQRANPF